MQYNVYFDLAAILNLVVILYAFFLHKRLPEAKNRAFLHFAGCALATTIIDVVSVYVLRYAENFSVSFLYFLNIVYYFLLVSIPFFYTLYALAITGEPELTKTRYLLNICFIPYVIDEVMVFLTPFLHILFRINPDKVYERMPGLYVMYVVLAFQILFGVIIILHYGNHLSGTKKQLSCSMIFLTSLAIIFQAFHPEVLLALFGVSVSLLLVFFSLQSTDNVTEELTGLFNKRSFQIMTRRLLKVKEEFSIVSVYLEELTFITKTFGLDGTNTLLKQIALFLKEIAPDCQIYHLRDDNYAIMIKGQASDDYSRISTAVAKRFTRSWKNEILEIKLSCRQCVIRCPHDAFTYEMILDTISTAIDDSRYKNEKLLFTENIDVSTRNRFTYVEGLVRTAIQERRISVYYQPIWSTSENRIVGAEALVRMKDRDGNFISPEEFVPISEQDGLILRIGQFVFEDVCRFLSTSYVKELGIHTVDINLSVAQCMQSRICEELLEIVKSYNLDISMINLEITETAAAHTPELLYSNMRKLNHVGFACTLDDYGSGYANLNYILHMPFQIIKIDKDIIWSAFKDVRAYVILTGIIDMIHKLNIKIVAEGIENKEMVEELTKLNVDYLQGFYYSKPVPENEFYEMVKSQARDEGIDTLNLDEVFPEELYPVDGEGIETLIPVDDGEDF